ncbi:MAG: hypothetical protein ACXVZV_13920 [Terriglobales bacterium]
MFIKILYVVLVLCVGAVVGAVIAGYLRIRRHMNGAGKGPEGTQQAEHEIRR